MLKLNTEKFLNVLNRLWTNKNCPMCSQNRWNVDNNLVTVLRVAKNGGVELGGQVMPLVAVTCMNCGNVMFVNPLANQCIDEYEEKESN